MKCGQFKLLRINGLVCHETGCPNAGKIWEDGQWARYRDCRECGLPVREGVACTCMEPIDEEAE